MPHEPAPPQPTAPTITASLQAFLAEQRRRLKPATLRKYEDVVFLLQEHLNGYAYESLSAVEEALFRTHYDAEGPDHREFCDLFGPDKIVEHVGAFLGYFMVRKVIAAGDLMRAAGTVTRKLSQWLAAKGYVSPEAAREAAEEGAAAARDLPRAERAARILYQAAEQLRINPTALDDAEYVEFDHHTIATVEPGVLWLRVHEGRERLLGPIPVPKQAADLLKPGWDISCALARIRGTWHLVEVANVYPL